VPVGLCADCFDQRSNLSGELAGRRTAIKAEVEGDLVVARPACMQGGPSWRDLREPPLDRRVDVLVGVEERERAGIKLFADAAQSSLDGGQL
jgi:hypothetical protein